MNDKWHGFRASHRNRWQLLSTQILTDKQFWLYEYLIDMADWGEKHKKYGMFEFFPEEIVEVFHKKTETINDWFKRLRQLGLVKLVDEKRSLYTVVMFDRYIGFHAKKYAREERGQSIRKILATWELIGDYSIKKHTVRRKNPTDNAISLEKDNCKVNDSIKERVNDWNGYGFGDYDLAEVFFGGDTEQYNLHLRRGNE